ncbi:hypothetical protein FRC07_012263 [Ceratobasidium sp. 392]|nr:hypothetical protein FRC07_012263 [Ceratobasidium sp. 392]
MVIVSENNIINVVHQLLYHLGDPSIVDRNGWTKTANKRLDIAVTPVPSSNAPNQSSPISIFSSVFQVEPNCFYVTPDLGFGDTPASWQVEKGLHKILAEGNGTLFLGTLTGPFPQLISESEKCLRNLNKVFKNVTPYVNRTGALH